MIELPSAKFDSDGPQVDTNSLEPMATKEIRQFRRSTVRLNYMALDCPDLAVAVIRLARCMASPRVGDEIGLKRILRYLNGVPICRSLLPLQELQQAITVMTDSDWSGCRITKSSTGKGLFSWAPSATQAASVTAYDRSPSFSQYPIHRVRRKQLHLWPNPLPNILPSDQLRHLVSGHDHGYKFKAYTGSFASWHPSGPCASPRGLAQVAFPLPPLSRRHPIPPHPTPFHATSPHAHPTALHSLHPHHTTPHHHRHTLSPPTATPFSSSHPLPPSHTPPPPPHSHPHLLPTTPPPPPPTSTHLHIHIHRHIHIHIRKKKQKQKQDQEQKQKQKQKDEHEHKPEPEPEPKPKLKLK